jgi:hypothetical protein
MYLWSALLQGSSPFTLSDGIQPAHSLPGVPAGSNFAHPNFAKVDCWSYTRVIVDLVKLLWFRTYGWLVNENQTKSSIPSAKPTVTVGCKREWWMWTGVFTWPLPCRTHGPEGICQAQWMPQNNDALPSKLHTREGGWVWLLYKVKCAPDLSGAWADRGKATVTTPWSLAANSHDTLSLSCLSSVTPIYIQLGAQV